MWPFGRSDAGKRVGFGRRPSADDRPRESTRPPESPETPSGPGGDFDTAIDVSAADARARDFIDRLPEDTPGWARKLVERAAPHAARAQARGAARPRQARGRLVVLAMMFLFSLGFVGAGLWLLVDTMEFTAAARPATGEVVEVIVHHDDDGTTWSARFAYTDASGTARRGKTHISSSGYDFEIGERIAILYDPSEPGTVRIDSWFSVWGFPVIFLGVGLGLEAVLVIVFISKARRRRTA